MELFTTLKKGSYKKNIFGIPKYVQKKKRLT